ncbi:ElyC/SanA/YdcF family protein [Synechococcus sp. EJ6-Ellesmere]|uniref:ElyC/SanA/YdcF family protein n=1 Tax=Synechococcus sp. EJ6-Ellesmere TaxID=2823734 RepID=UPI0020CEC119|nr:ElyC/SanA/YdcF family protein [Synechococcus sp. EJ6-Ellesmere]MCP9826368.1 YdcF family protein [Synechococcus sp. EJ6-Ellesmere]
MRCREPAALVAIAAAGVWLSWPWLAPRLWPAAGGEAIVVFAEDPRRTVAALDLWQQDPSRQLVIQGFPSLQGIARRQLAARQPGPAAMARVTTLTCGVDTVGQLTCLADWIRRRRQTLALGQVTLVSDRAHLPRVLAIAEIVLGGAGIRVQGLGVPIDEPAEHPLRRLRDQWRAQVWRATGWDGRPAFLQRQPLLLHQGQ